MLIHHPILGCSRGSSWSWRWIAESLLNASQTRLLGMRLPLILELIWLLSWRSVFVHKHLLLHLLLLKKFLLLPTLPPLLLLFLELLLRFWSCLSSSISHLRLLFTSVVPIYDVVQVERSLGRRLAGLLQRWWPLLALRRLGLLHYGRRLLFDRWRNRLLDRFFFLLLDGSNFSQLILVKIVS